MSKERILEIIDWLENLLDEQPIKSYYYQDEINELRRLINESREETTQSK